jgi:hypothetical protein
LCPQKSGRSKKKIRPDRAAKPGFLNKGRRVFIGRKSRAVFWGLTHQNSAKDEKTLFASLKICMRESSKSKPHTKIETLKRKIRPDRAAKPGVLDKGRRVFVERKKRRKV